jgi:hypothetical protein
MALATALPSSTSTQRHVLALGRVGHFRAIATVGLGRRRPEEVMKGSSMVRLDRIALRVTAVRNRSSSDRVTRNAWVCWEPCRPRSSPSWGPAAMVASAFAASVSRESGCVTPCIR